MRRDFSAKYRIMIFSRYPNQYQPWEKFHIFTQQCDNPQEELQVFWERAAPSSLLFRGAFQKTNVACCFVQGPLKTNSFIFVFFFVNDRLKMSKVQNLKGLVEMRTITKNILKGFCRYYFVYYVFQFLSFFLIITLTTLYLPRAGLYYHICAGKYSGSKVLPPQVCKHPNGIP